MKVINEKIDNESELDEYGLKPPRKYFSEDEVELFDEYNDWKWEKEIQEKTKERQLNERVRAERLAKFHNPFYVGVILRTQPEYKVTFFQVVASSKKSLSLMALETETSIVSTQDALAMTSPVRGVFVKNAFLIPKCKVTLDHQGNYIVSRQGESDLIAWDGSPIILEKGDASEE